jgi:polyhydroxyalkanoate synthase
VTTASPGGALDRVRRELERNAIRARNGLKYLSGADWTPPAPTPRDAVWRQGPTTLWRYRNDQVRVGPPVLMFIGLVSTSAIFDLHEKTSLVADLRDQGFDVYVLDWGAPGPGDGANTLETYLCKYLPRAIQAVLRTSAANEVSVVGYCMGGAMAISAMAAQPNLPIRNLVTMATPVDFDHVGVRFEALHDPAQEVQTFIDPETGCVPGNVIGSLFTIRKPTASAVQYANLVENLWNDAYVESHQAISRWTAAHVPLPGGVAMQVVDTWLRGNSFVSGTLRLKGRPADLRNITCPVLSVLTLSDEIIPPASARPIVDVLNSQDHELLEIEAGHIGLLIGRSAKKVSFPGIIGWLLRHSEHQEA